VLCPVILKLEATWCTYYMASNTEDHSLQVLHLNQSVLRATCTILNRELRSGKAGRRYRYHFHRYVMQCIIVFPTFIKMLILFI